MIEFILGIISGIIVTAIVGRWAVRTAVKSGIVISWDYRTSIDVKNK